MKKRLQKKQAKRSQESTSMQINQKSFFDIFIKWLTWQKAGVIITGVGILVSIVLFVLGRNQPPTPIEVIKSDITSNIEIIEKTFNPNEIETKDSIYKEFQIQSIQLATLWTAIENTKPYKESIDNGIPSLVSTLSHDFARIDKLNDKMNSITTLWVAMRNAEISKGDSLFSIFNYAKLYELNNKLILKKSISDKYHENCLNHLKAASKSTISKKECYDRLKEAMQELDNMKNDTNYYKLDKELFEFIIEVNNMYKANM